MSRDSQALRVRYVGPTNTKPARAVVTQKVPDRTLRHSMEWRDDLDPRENRLLAVQEFLDNQFNPYDPAEKLSVNPEGLYFDGDYYYTWETSKTETTEQTLVSFDFTLDNIISVKAPKSTDPETLRDQAHEELKDLIFDNCDSFTFEGISEQDDTET